MHDKDKLNGAKQSCSFSSYGRQSIIIVKITSYNHHKMLEASNGYKILLKFKLSISNKLILKELAIDNKK